MEDGGEIDYMNMLFSLASYTEKAVSTPKTEKRTWGIGSGSFLLTVL